MTQLFNGQQLVGHVSPETAFVVADYPYGFILRCSIRYWVETKPGYGQRFVSQTTNPKKPGVVWNKPKAGTYSPVVVMYQEADGKGHVKHCVLSRYVTEDLERVEAFADLVLDGYQQRMVRVVLVHARRQRGAAYPTTAEVFDAAPD